MVLMNTSLYVPSTMALPHGLRSSSTITTMNIYVPPYLALPHRVVSRRSHGTSLYQLQLIPFDVLQFVFMYSHPGGSWYGPPVDIWIEFFTLVLRPLVPRLSKWVLPPVPWRQLIVFDSVSQGVCLNFQENVQSKPVLYRSGLTLCAQLVPTSSCM